MTKKILFVIIILVMAFQLVSASTKRIPLPDINKPGDLVSLDDTQLYLTEGVHIYIYSLNDLKLVKMVGKKGEGPQELMLNQGTPLYIDVAGKNIVVHSFGKLSWWTKQGVFLREMKVGVQIYPVGTFGKYYIASKFKPRDKTLWRYMMAFDENMKEVKELADTEHNFTPGKGLSIAKFNPLRAIYKDKLYVAWENDMAIKVYDSKLNQINTIKHKMDRIKVTEQDKKDIIDFIKTDASTKQIYPFLKPITFPDYYPAIAWFTVTDQMIYLYTFKTVENRKKAEFLIFDQKGEFIERVLFPLKMTSPIKPYPFTIHKGHVYQVVEDEEEEEWVLEVTKIGTK